jgi:hypothetical protein
MGRSSYDFLKKRRAEAHLGSNAGGLLLLYLSLITRLLLLTRVLKGL